MTNADPNVVIYADADKCRACRKCELACIASHNNLTMKEAIKSRKELEPRVHVVKTEALKMPVQCRQCEDAPCALVCPTQALVQDNNGPIVMRSQHCAGCGLCVMACPFGAITRTFIKLTEEEKLRLDREEPRFVAMRCDQCTEWRAKEHKNVTACMEACPVGALHMIPLEEYRKMMAERSLTADQAQLFNKIVTSPEEETMEPTACVWPPRETSPQPPEG